MEILNKGELARHFGVSPQSVDNWVRKGCPIISKRTPGNAQCRFNLADVREWRAQTATLQTLTQEARRENLATGVRQISDGVIRHRLNVLREKLTDLPHKLAPELSKCVDQAKCAQILRKEIDPIVASVDFEKSRR